MSTFSADVDRWVAQSEARGEAVFRESAFRVISEAQKPVSEGGRMRIDTGFLRASAQVLINQPAPPAIRENPGTPVTYNAGAIVATIAGAQLGDYIVLAYTANYALPREMGANGQEPDAFVRSAAAQWPQIVAKVTQEAKSRSRAS